MKNAYPIVLTKTDNGFLVYIPDFDINTEGVDMPDAMEMARDAIGIMGIDMEDDKKSLPAPTEPKNIALNDGELLTLVDVDFTEYRRKNDMRSVKKNCTVPSWLCYEAEKANINFSAVLQAGLKNALRIQD